MASVVSSKRRVRRRLIRVVRPHHTFLTKRTVGVSFCCLAVVLFLSRYVFALWYQGGAHRSWSSELFARQLEYVGVAPWVFAATFLVAGILFLIRGERDN